MGSVCRNKGPDNEPGNENAKQNKTGRNAVVAESRLYLLQLLAASQRLYLCLGCCFPQCWSRCFTPRAVGREDDVLFKASVALTLTQPECPTTTEGCEQGDASQHLLGQALTAGDIIHDQDGGVPFPAHAGVVPC